MSTLISNPDKGKVAAFNYITANANTSLMGLDRQRMRLNTKLFFFKALSLGFSKTKATKARLSANHFLSGQISCRADDCEKTLLHFEKVNRSILPQQQANQFPVLELHSHLSVAGKYEKIFLGLNEQRGEEPLYKFVSNSSSDWYATTSEKIILLALMAARSLKSASMSQAAAAVESNDGNLLGQAIANAGLSLEKCLFAAKIAKRDFGERDSLFEEARQFATKLQHQVNVRLGRDVTIKIFGTDGRLDFGSLLEQAAKTKAQEAAPQQSLSYVPGC
ncbi:hypothetical protein FJZ26_00305 [Candidatus Parvarchaeota archaeon]|nr:hypothetical protein [Candidatus Parvarchaeota archaeon]